MKEYMVYAKEECPYCVKLLKHLKEQKISFVYIVFYDLDRNLKSIMERYRWRTVPLVVEMDYETKEEKFIGGCDDTIEYLKEVKKNDE